MKPTAVSQDRFDPRRNKPPVWIEGEFIVTSATTTAKPEPKPAVPLGRRERRRGGLPGLGELILRLLGVAAACAATIALALVWALVAG